MHVLADDAQDYCVWVALRVGIFNCHFFQDEPPSHRVDREDITIIILDTKLVPDFVQHTFCFFIAGNRPVVMLLRSANKSISDENRAAKS